MASASMHVPRYLGHSGNPVLITRELYPAIAQLSEDTGARALRERETVEASYIETDCPGILVDYDTEAALDGLVGRCGS